MTPAYRGNTLRRAVLPLAAFLAVVASHYVLVGLFPERNPVQARWASVPTQPRTWFTRYAESGSYWLGFSYGLSLAFAVSACRRYREQRSRTARNLAIGGTTFCGVLAIAGCFLIGCCGSPMLIVWLNLFGAAFLPLAKPLVAALTLISVGSAWWWMSRRLQPTR